MDTESAYSILVVDDEESILKIMVKALTRKGYRVYEGSCYDDALESLSKQPVDLLLTDYMMPGKSGLDLLVDTSKLYPDMMRLLVTGLGEKDLYREAINKGSVFSVIEKPVPLDHLYDIVGRALEYRAGRARDQEEIRLLREQYHNLFDMTSDLIQCIDDTGSFIYVNPAWHNVLGYEEDDLITLALTDIIREDFREQILEITVRVRNNEVVEPFELVMMTKDNNAVYIEGTVAAQGQEKGVVAITFILRDVTERRQAEKEIQNRLKQEIMVARIAHLLAIAEEPTFVTSAILEIVGVSAKVDRAYIYSVDENGKTFTKLDTWCSTTNGSDSQWEDEVPFKKIPWISTTATNESIICISNREELSETDRLFMEKHNIMASLIFPIRTGITFVGILGFDVLEIQRTWEDNEIALLRASVDIIANAWTRQQEIDYRKEKEREAEQSRLLVIRADRLAALGTMVAGIIHEITQPLNAINVSTQTILYGLSRGWSLDEDKTKNSLTLIVDQIKRMNEIITNMRAFSRDGLPAVRETESLNTLFKRARSMLGEQMNAHGIEFKLELGAIPESEMNTQQIFQVILNLVTNSRQALDETQIDNKKITISTYVSDKDLVVFEISDNGPGIPPDLQEKIFDPFFTTKDVGKGTGLGLSISSGIVNDHNGVLDIRTNDSGGATFVVKLPVHLMTKEIIDS